MTPKKKRFSNCLFFFFRVVIRLGSQEEFSNTLIELQEEVRPLSKLQYCPRDFKRTTVERLFRDENFILDWCNFKLVSFILFAKTKKNFIKQLFINSFYILD